MLSELEINAAVAEKIMGVEPWPGRPGAFRARYVPTGQEAKPCLPPDYATDIRCAWTVAEKLIQDGWEFSLFMSGQDYDLGLYKGLSRKIHVQAASVPLAICLAALKTAQTPPGSTMLPKDDPRAV